jgi:hypothetical protein
MLREFELSVIDAVLFTELQKNCIEQLNEKEQRAQQQQGVFGAVVGGLLCCQLFDGQFSLVSHGVLMICTYN